LPHLLSCGVATFGAKGTNIRVITDHEQDEIARLLEERRRLMDGGIDDAVTRRVAVINRSTGPRTRLPVDELAVTWFVLADR
jgi:hypothetical protein